ncbi:DNA repair ATPase [Leifsonia xyli subsp. cynodontis DSM 46306]|uniref:ATPase n=1 Tax=Leifsonia xyli subsp. cynodontis DSM 46306 TaxID=1389489 RepID=U3P4K4_LEIXC|nr:DNA repair ATPase [Leifsonia xyli subsp. cynodontis DSM 46306]
MYVREGDGERAVGQYPDGTPEEAIAYFEHKYLDLAGQVGLLEQRARRGAPATGIAKSVSTLRAAVDGANAVGDLAGLSTRLNALSGVVEELTEQQSAEAKAALDQAVTDRTAIVEEAEALAAQDPAHTQWKQTTATLDALFARWQTHQHEGPRLPKGEANELWKRFRSARSSIEHNRKAFFAELDNQHRDVRTRKNALIESAERLIPLGADGVPEYRRLLDQWKLAGRAGKKNDDALWARFKAAGDAIYSAKAEVDARDNEEYEANLQLKLALLEEAEPLLNEKDRETARATLLAIQERWDAIGRVPRDHVRTVEDRLRKVEASVRRLDEEHWQRNDPEKKARSEGLASQLNTAIAKLEHELDEAKAGGDADKVKASQEALDARRIWLNALG